jgi:hypothetical protein
VEILVGSISKMQNPGLYFWVLPYLSQKVVAASWRYLHLFGSTKPFPDSNRPIKFLLS